MEEFVSNDGSPVAIYLASPPDDTAVVVHRAAGPGTSVLELGSGPGRATRPLVALGHAVTAVDDAEEMLEHVTGARTVCADVLALDLAERFDVVLAASHLINLPTARERRALLDVCRRHVADDGVVLVERFAPGWLLTAGPATARRGPVELAFEPGAVDGTVRSAAMTYRLGGRVWTQHFDASDVDDDTLAAEARAVGLQFDRPLDRAGIWVALRPDPAATGDPAVSLDRR